MRPPAVTPALLRRELRATIFGAVLLGSVVASCGGATREGSDGGPTDNPGVEICDGRAGVRLAAVSGGGGLAPPGVDMLSENGWHYLLVSGQCEAWVLKEVAAPLRHLLLSREQARSLAREFRLGEWSSITAAAGGCPDAPTVRFRFDKEEIAGGPCGLKTDHPIFIMSTALLMQVGNLYAAGVSTEADVRYLLGVEDPDAPRTGDAYRNAPLWPLSTPPDAVAVPTKELHSYRRGGSRHASNGEASLLRALRTSWLDGTIGSKMSEFIPIVENDGARFRLYVRDASPWENASGLLPEDLTWR